MDTKKKVRNTNLFLGNSLSLTHNNNNNHNNNNHNNNNHSKKLNRRPVPPSIPLPHNYQNLTQFIKNHKKEISNAKKKYNEFLEKGEKREVLILCACHSNNSLKMESFEKNLYYLNMVPHSDIVIINSAGLDNSRILKETFAGHYLKYMEVPNDNLLDFGKWLYALNNINLDKYQYVCFVNDSIIIEHPINYFFDLLRTKNIDFYGYNNSTQTRFHIQTYLFSINTTSIPTFIQFIKNSIPKITNNPESVVHHYELKLTDIFKRFKTLINTRKFSDHQGKNIFFNNDFLYIQLKKQGLFPFVKIKRIIK